MATVLIASLGDSPVVITSMFKRLQEAQDIYPIDRLEVLCPEEEVITIGYNDIICKYLCQQCDIANIPLQLDDVNDEQETYHFLHTLAQLLNTHQDDKDTIYLSLAGGRKSMSSLMALLAPLFPCVKKLYHLLDTEEVFFSTAELFEMQPARLQDALFPPTERVKLIDIPYDKTQYADENFRKSLNWLTDEFLDNLWENDPEQAKALTYFGSMTTSNRCQGVIPVKLTREVAEQFRTMQRFDVTHAVNFRKCFEEMHFAVRLDQRSKDIYSYKGKHFHYYKRRRTAERPVFCTEPVDIKSNPDAEITEVIVTALPIEIEERRPPYPPLAEVVKKLKFPLETEEFDVTTASSEEQARVLIIPLATTPMIATQLYRLYQDKGYKIRKIVIVHTMARAVRSSVRIVEEAFQFRNITCDVVPLHKLEDIDSEDACAEYQKLLEQTIERLRTENPDCQLELTISGGRKCMAALAMFAAQKQEIHRVVHTLITDEIFAKRVSEETSLKKLTELSSKNRKRELDRLLFLDAYQSHRNAFTLFHIPVVPVQKG
jgi:CRISPR-associated Csx14 family protein